MFIRPDQRVNLERLQQIAAEAVARYGSDWSAVRQHIAERLQGLSKDEAETLEKLVASGASARSAGSRH
jgi:hypothetical protein